MSSLDSIVLSRLGGISSNTNSSMVMGNSGGSPGISGGPPGVSSGTPGVSGGIPGVSGGIPGISGGIPGMSGGNRLSSSSTILIFSDTIQLSVTSGTEEEKDIGIAHDYVDLLLSDGSDYNVSDEEALSLYSDFKKGGGNSLPSGGNVTFVVPSRVTGSSLGIGSSGRLQLNIATSQYISGAMLTWTLMGQYDNQSPDFCIPSSVNFVGDRCIDSVQHSVSSFRGDGYYAEYYLRQWEARKEARILTDPHNFLDKIYLDKEDPSKTLISIYDTQGNLITSGRPNEYGYFNPQFLQSVWKETLKFSKKHQGLVNFGTTTPSDYNTYWYDLFGGVETEALASSLNIDDILGKRITAKGNYEDTFSNDPDWPIPPPTGELFNMSFVDTDRYTVIGSFSLPADNVAFRVTICPGSTGANNDIAGNNKPVFNISIGTGFDDITPNNIFSNSVYPDNGIWDVIIPANFGTDYSLGIISPLTDVYIKIVLVDNWFRSIPNILIEKIETTGIGACSYPTLGESQANPFKYIVLHGGIGVSEEWFTHIVKSSSPVIPSSNTSIRIELPIAYDGKYNVLKCDIRIVDVATGITLYSADDSDLPEGPLVINVPTTQNLSEINSIYVSVRPQIYTSYPDTKEVLGIDNYIGLTLFISEGNNIQPDIDTLDMGSSNDVMWRALPENLGNGGWSRAPLLPSNRNSVKPVGFWGGINENADGDAFGEWYDWGRYLTDRVVNFPDNLNCEKFNRVYQNDKFCSLYDSQYNEDLIGNYYRVYNDWYSVSAAPEHALYYKYACVLGITDELAGVLRNVVFGSAAPDSDISHWVPWNGMGFPDAIRVRYTTMPGCSDTALDSEVSPADNSSVPPHHWMSVEVFDESGVAIGASDSNNNGDGYYKSGDTIELAYPTHPEYPQGGESPGDGSSPKQQLIFDLGGLYFEMISIAKILSIEILSSYNGSIDYDRIVLAGDGPYDNLQLMVVGERMNSITVHESNDIHLTVHLIVEPTEV